MPKAQFSLRECLLLMTITAMALGWYIDRTRKAAQHEIAIAELMAKSDEQHWKADVLADMAREDGYSLTWTASTLSYYHNVEMRGGMRMRPMTISCSF